MKEYYKIILSIHFHFIPFSPPKLIYRYEISFLLLKLNLFLLRFVFVKRKDTLNTQNWARYTLFVPNFFFFYTLSSDQDTNRYLV